jgi:hypothetical protein
LPHDGGNNAGIMEGKKTNGGNYHPWLVLVDSMDKLTFCCGTSIKNNLGHQIIVIEVNFVLKYS